jgi:sortase A
MKRRVLISCSYVVILIGITMFALNAYYLTQGILSIQDIDSQMPYTPPQSSTSVEVPRIGDEIGSLTIPRLNQTFPIYHGTTEETLKKGVGHYEQSVLPGERNNSVLSGHRDTVFRGLRHLREKDSLVVSTQDGEFVYKIRRIRIVNKNDRSVIVPKPKATLTITTCYPFYFIGDANERYIIVADLIKSVRRG